MSTPLILPEGYVCINNVTGLWNNKTGLYPSQEVSNSTVSYGLDDWKLTKKGRGHYPRVTLEHTLESPSVLKAIIKPDDLANIYITGEVMVEQDCSNNEFEFIVFKANDPKDKKVYMVVSYSYTRTSNLPKKNVAFDVKIPLCGAEKGTQLKVYLFKEDPKTSRGTVTTVIHHMSTVENQCKEESAI